MPGGVPMCWAVLVFLVFIPQALTRQPDPGQTRLVAPIRFAVLGPAWMVGRRRPGHLRQFKALGRELSQDGQSFQGRPASLG